MGSGAKEHKESVTGDGAALYLGCGGSCAGMCQNSRNVTPNTHPPYPSLSSQVASLTISRQRGTVAEGYRGEGTEEQNIRGQCLGKSFGGCYLYMELTRSRVKLTEFSKKNRVPKERKSLA